MGEIKNFVLTCKWFQVYDLLEGLYSEISIRRWEWDKSSHFEQKVNNLCEIHNVGWRMQGGMLNYKGEEAFETAVETAIAALSAAGKNTAKDELHKAVEDLSKRPAPDRTGAVQHAMAALECVATNVCRAEGLTLGQVIKKHPERFPNPVGQAVSMLYGFASQKGRHITEGGEPDFREVELIVGISATVAIYLIR